MNSFPDASGAKRQFYRSLALERPQLFAAIMRFNASNNFKDREYNGAEKIIDDSNRAKALFYGGFTKVFWDFEEDSRRIALLDTDTFKKMILSWGAAFCAPLLNSFILKTDIEKLNQNIGREFLDFARGKGRFSLGDVSDIIKIKTSSTNPEKMGEQVITAGMHAYGICSEAWPQPLKEIAAERIGKDLPELSRHHKNSDPVSPPHLRAIWFSMKKILLKEVAPQWTPCFS